MGQNATERAMRQGILSTPLGEFHGYCLAVDCGTPTCGGERTYTISNLAQLYGEAMTMSRVVVRLRCRICGGSVRSCFLETGPELAQRARMRRVSLIGREGVRTER